MKGEKGIVGFPGSRVSWAPHSGYLASPVDTVFIKEVTLNNTYCLLPVFQGPFGSDGRPGEEGFKVTR